LAGNPPDPTLARWIRPGMVLPDLRASSAEGVIEELADAVARALPALSGEAVRRGFREREALGTTAIGDGVAIPHCRVAGAAEVHLRVARHPEGVAFAAPDGLPVRLFFALIAPQGGATAHLEALRGIARFLRDPVRRAQVLAASGAEELLARLQGAVAGSPLSEVTADV
jgi:PTS system nitrogen regulatory IIA component